MAPYRVVMVRHGESEWNQENRFCGWVDADLSETGVPLNNPQLLFFLVCLPKVTILLKTCRAT